MQDPNAALMQKMFCDIGAVRVEVTNRGVATHWLTEMEAEIAKGKLQEMGLWFVEKFRDNGCFAVFGRFPIPDALYNRKKFPTAIARDN